jgi:hypothetical protein
MASFAFTQTVMTDEEKQARRRALARERSKRYAARNPERVKANMAKNSAAYRKRIKRDPSYADAMAERKRKAVARTKAWQAANPERVKAHAKAGRQKNKHKEAAKVQARNALKLKATPVWADKSAILRMYENARYLTEVTGFEHHVDHIVPLRGAQVCGLHVENNLRVVPAYINLRKGNRVEVKVNA